MPNARKACTLPEIDGKAAPISTIDTTNRIVTKARPPRRAARNLSRSLVQLLHEHDTLQGVFDEAEAAARRLDADPSAEDAAEHCLTAWQFVFTYAIPHIDHEDAHDFPTLVAAGASVDELRTLGEDHAALRVLATQLDRAGLRHGTESLTVHAASLLLRFVRVFEGHAAREETTLRTIVIKLAHDVRIGAP